jgi:hypothetical protein
VAKSALSTRVGNALGLVALALAMELSASTARADMVGAFDPELAQICGGSAHHPRCPSELVGLCCCGGFGFAAAGVIVFFTMGRREKS